MQVVDPVGQAEGDSAPDGGDDGPGESAAESCHIHLRLLTEEPSPPVTGWLVPALKRIIALADEPRCSGGSITVAIVDDTRMARMHEQYTSVPGTTDVLTFDLSDDPQGPVEVDLVICADEAKRQAAARGHEARLELLLYCVHGLLHLLGYDDHDELEARRMHAREDELLVAAGFGAVYRAGDEETNV